MGIFRKLALIGMLGGGVTLLTACDPTTVQTGGSVYYDSMLWNDYYYGRPRPPQPERPPRPEHPIEPPGGVRPPVGRPPVARPPVARPPVARPPIHRPPAGRPRPR